MYFKLVINISYILLPLKKCCRVAKKISILNYIQLSGLLHDHLSARHLQRCLVESKHSPLLSNSSYCMFFDKSISIVSEIPEIKPFFAACTFSSCLYCSFLQTTLLRPSTLLKILQSCKSYHTNPCTTLLIDHNCHPQSPDPYVIDLLFGLKRKNKLN